jgi:hypothetical protein
MNLILLLILSLSQCVYYVNMSINRNGDGSYGDNDVFESLQFVYTRKKRTDSFYLYNLCSKTNDELHSVDCSYLIETINIYSTHFVCHSSM